MFLYAVIEASTLMIGISKKKLGQILFALFVAHIQKLSISIYAVIEASTLVDERDFQKERSNFFCTICSPFSKIFHFRFSDLTEGVQVSQGNASTLVFLSNIVHVQL